MSRSMAISSYDSISREGSFINYWTFLGWKRGQRIDNTYYYSFHGRFYFNYGGNCFKQFIEIILRILL